MMIFLLKQDTDTETRCHPRSLHWRHNGRDGVSNHQPHHGLLNRLFRCRSKKTSKLRVAGLCARNSPVTGEFPHKWPVTRKMFLFDDVIKISLFDLVFLQPCAWHIKTRRDARTNATSGAAVRHSVNASARGHGHAKTRTHTDPGMNAGRILEVHYNDVIMTTMASQITSLTVVYSTVYSDADQRKYQSSASLAFVWGIHRDRWIPRTKGQLRGKCFHLMTSSWRKCHQTAIDWK